MSKIICYGNKRKKNIEVDFVVPEHEIAIQVCYRLRNDINDTFQRETSALVAYKKFSQFKNLFIITYEEEEVITIEDTEIKVLPIWKWLLS